MITRPKSKCFLFIVYNSQKRCHFIAFVFFLLFISCNRTPSSLILRSIHIILRNPRVLKKMERLLFIIEMENLKAWVILLKELPMGPLLFTTATVMNCIEDFLLMANHQENGCLQIQKIMKKQSNLIKINFFNFRYNNFLYHYHSFLFIL